MIAFKLNGKSYDIPTCWEDVTFKQFIKYFDYQNDDKIQLVSIFTDIDYDFLRKADVILGLEGVLTALTFIYTKQNFPGSVNQVGPYKIPNNMKGQFNIQHESLAQFEDMRAIMNKLSGTDVKEYTKAYLKYCAIYIQKIRDKEYKPLMVPEVEDELENYPAYQICSLGAFFFLKLRSFLTPMPASSQSISPNPKKSKPVMKGSKRRSEVSEQLLKRRKR